jgi:hypothetical protein
VSTDITGLIIAVVGVTGTLTAPVVTQRFAIRARKQELDAAQQQRVQDRDVERRRTDFADRRAAYIELNAAMRAFRRAIRDDLIESSQQCRDELEQARRTFDRRTAEVQLIGTDVVLEAFYPFSDMLFRLYDGVVRADTHEAEDPERAKREREALLDVLEHRIPLESKAFRAVMRWELSSDANRSG